MTLSGFERRWLARIYGAILPASDDPRFPEGAEALGAERFAADLVRTAPSDVGFGLRALTWLLTWVAPLFVLGRFASFGGLSPEDQARLLERLSESDVYLVREAPMLFKMTACLGICGLPDVQRRVGVQTVDATPPAWANDTRPRLPVARNAP